MNNFSKTGVGLLTLIIIGVGAHFGLPIDNASAEGFALSIVTGIAAVITLYGQITRKDMKYGLIRKDTDEVTALHGMVASLHADKADDREFAERLLSANVALKKQNISLEKQVATIEVAKATKKTVGKKK